MTQVSKARSVANKPQEFRSIREFEGSGDGVTKNDTALAAANAALPSGATLIFPEDDAGVYLFDTDVQITRSDITYKGNVVWKSSTVVSGDSAVATVSGAVDNVNFDGIQFNANAQRRWGLRIEDDCTNCSAKETDAFYYTDVEGIGIRVSSDTQVTLAVNEVIPKLEDVSVTLQAGGSLPSGRTFRSFPRAVDALGREAGIITTSGASGTAKTTSAGNQQIEFVWKHTRQARSYRLYIYDEASADSVYDRFYGVPVPVGASEGDSITKVMSENWADKPSNPTISLVAGSSSGLKGHTWTFGAAAIYADGLTVSSRTSNVGNSDIRIDSNAQVIRLGWTAPSGATPIGYRISISNENSGGLRNYFQTFDIGNVTTYDFNGSENLSLHYKYGNADAALTFGNSQDNYDGHNKQTTVGERQQIQVERSKDNTYQFLSISNTTDETPSSFFHGIETRLKRTVDTIVQRLWQIGGYGNSRELWFRSAISGKTPLKLHYLGHLLKPDSAAAAEYLAVSTSSVTGDGTLVTIPFDTEEFDRAGNLSGGTFTTPAAGTNLYRITARILFTPTASTTDSELIISIGGTSYRIRRTDLTASSPTSLIFSDIIEVAASTAIICRFRASGSGSKDIAITGGSSRDTSWSVELIG